MVISAVEKNKKGERNSFLKPELQFKWRCQSWPYRKDVALRENDRDGQGGLACCSPQGHKESGATEPLNWRENEPWQYPGRWGGREGASQTGGITAKTLMADSRIISGERCRNWGNSKGVWPSDQVEHRCLYEAFRVSPFWAGNLKKILKGKIRWSDLSFLKAHSGCWIETRFGGRKRKAGGG